MRCSGCGPGWAQASQAESGDHVRGGRDGRPVRRGGQADHVSELAFGQPDGLDAGFAGHRADLQRVGAGRVGDPDRLPGFAEHPRQPGPGRGIDRQRAGRAVLVRQPVHRAAHLDHAGLPGLVAIQAAQVIAGGDQPGGAGRRRGTQGDLELAGLRRVGAVQDPDVAGHVVDDPLPVRGRVPRVHPVVVGVPADAAAVQRARVDVPGALVIGQEEQPPCDQHRRGELAVQAGEHAGEQRVRAGGGPQLAAGAAAVPLPERGLGVHPAGEQGRARLLQGKVGHRAERQPARWLTLERDRVRPGQVRFGLAGGGDREDLTVLGPFRAGRWRRPRGPHRAGSSR